MGGGVILRFNVNEKVRVKLTEQGRAALAANHAELVRWTGTEWRDPPAYQPPIEDADGYSKWQLWVLMQELGPHLRLGGPQLFVNNVIEFLASEV